MEITIKLKLGKKEIKLTRDEFEELRGFFDGLKAKDNWYPYLYYPYPDYPYPDYPYPTWGASTSYCDTTYTIKNSPVGDGAPDSGVFGIQ